MCVIIVKPAEVSLTKDALRTHFTANPDGWGLMWLDEGQMQTVKGLSGFDTFWRYYNVIQDRGLAIHFRTASASGKGLLQCHPHMVGADIAFMHNGNLFQLASYYGKGLPGDKSDSMRFAELLATFTPGFLDRPEIMEDVEAYCQDNMSKVVFLSSHTGFKIVNEAAGYWRDGIWYSNGGLENYTGYGFSGAYYYHAGDVRHKGGLVNVRMFGERAKGWQQCSQCLGWFEELSGDVCKSCQLFGRLKRHAGLLGVHGGAVADPDRSGTERHDYFGQDHRFDAAEHLPV